MVGLLRARHRPSAFWLPWVTLAVGLWLQAGEVGGWGIPAMTGDQGSLPPGQGGVIPGYNVDGPHSGQARPTENLGEVTGRAGRVDVNVAPKFHTLPPPVSQSRHPSTRGSVPTTPQAPSPLELPTPLIRTLPPLLGPQGLPYPPGTEKGGGSPAPTDGGQRPKAKPGAEHQASGEARSPSPPGLRGGEGRGEHPSTGSARTSPTIPTRSSSEVQATRGEPNRSVTGGEGNRNPGGSEAELGVSARTTLAHAAATLPLVTTPRSTESEGPFLQEPHASTTTKPIDERGGTELHPPDIAGSLTSPRRPWKPWPTHPASGMIRGGAGRAPTSRGDRVTELPPDLPPTSPSHRQGGSVEETTRRSLAPTPAAPERQNPSQNATHSVEEVDQHHASIENEHQGHVTMENVTDVTGLLEPQRNVVEGGSGSGAEGNQTEGGGEGGLDGPMAQATKTSKDDVHKATTIAGVAPAAGMENSKLEMGTDYISGIFPTLDILRPTATVIDSMLATEGHQSAVDVESSRIFSAVYTEPSEQTTLTNVFSSRIETSEVTVLDSSLSRTMIPQPEQTPSLWSTATILQTSIESHRSPSNETIAASVSLAPSEDWSLMMEKMLSDKLLGKSRKPASESDSPESASHIDTFTLSFLFSDFAISSSNSLEITGGSMYLSSITDVPTHLTDSQSSEVPRSRRDFSPSLTISPTSTRSYSEEASTERLHSETVSHLGVPNSRVVVEPSLSYRGESFTVMSSSTFAELASTSLGVSGELSEATSSYSASGLSSTGQTQVTVSSVSRTQGETGVTSTSSPTTSGAVLPTGDHEIVLHNSTFTTTPSSADTTSGPSTTGTQDTTGTSPSGNSPSDSGASTSSGGAARRKTTTSLPPTSDTPTLPPADNSSLVAENATEVGGDERKDRPGKSPKPPGQEGPTPGSDLGPGVTTEAPGGNETDRGNSTSLPGPAVLSSSSSSSSSPLSSGSVQSVWTSSAFHQGSLSTTSPLDERVTASSGLSDLAGETYRSSVNPSGTLFVQGTSTPGIFSTPSLFFSSEVILASAAVPTPSLPESTTQGFHTFSSETVSGLTQSSSVEVEATASVMTSETNSVFDSSVVSSEPVTTESPVWTQNETSPADNATTPSVRTLPNPLNPTSPSSSPSPSSAASPLPSSPTPVFSSTPVSRKQTTAGPSSSTTPLPRTPRGFSSTRRPPATTSALTPPSPTTPPPVFLRVRLQMSWSQFCQQQENFREELSRVLRGSTVYTATINRTQIVLMNARVEQCLERLLLPEPEQEEITIQVYFVDATGRYDGRLTITSASLIKAGFSLQDTSFFKDRLLDVRLSTDTERAGGEAGQGAGAGSSGSLFPEPGTTIVAVIGTIGGVCCVALVILQVALIRRRYGRMVRVYVPGGRHYGSAHSDSIALASVTKCRPHSGLYNPTFNAADLDLTHPINAAGLARVCQDTELIQEEFQSIPNETPPLTSVPAGAEDKNRYANVIPIPETRVKLRRRLSQPASDYINANYIAGHKEDSRAYIATQAPLEGTTADLWRMVWEQQCRAILMLTPMDPRGKPQVGQVYWPESETAIQRYGDFRVALKKRDVTQEYIHCILELKEIESNLVREVQHFWLTCWPMQECPQPLAVVKFVLDTRPAYEDSGAPVVVMCSAGTGRSGVFIATDICMRQFEARRVVDILNCVYRLRRERAGMVQTRDQYTLIYQALHEYASVMTAPGHHAV